MNRRPTNRPHRPTNPTNPSEPLPAKILEHLETLKVPFSREQLDHVLHQAEQHSWSYLELLEAFLGPPAQRRRERSVERRIREAHFPGIHTLEHFDWAFNAAAIDRLQIEELATGDFIRRKDNFRTPDIRLRVFERLVGPNRQLQAEAGTGEFGSEGVEFRA
jgi:hypothetical protein